MKKLFFLTAAFALSMMAQAQNILSFGFEDADKGKDTHCQYALTPDQSRLGDWVNVQEGDNWIEQSKEAAHSGEYGLQVLNTEVEGAELSWNRGFKIANLPVKENVPYRVSFWVKTSADAKLTSWVSVGMENFDKSLCTSDNKNYGLDQITIAGDDEWHRVSYVTMYHGRDAVKTVIDGQSWVGNAVFPEGFGGNGSETYKEHFGGYIPETFFFIANMFTNSVEYCLDDILIEENVAVKGCTFNNDVVKIDFGFPTNTAALANENGGRLRLPASYFKVTQDGKEVAIATVEAHNDGFVYAFTEDGSELNNDGTIVVSFTPDANCPIVYNSTQRPVAQENATVLAFANEVGYVDENIDATSALWEAPEFVSVVPENNSFNLSPSDVSEIVLTFNMPISVDHATVALAYNDNFGNSKEIELAITANDCDLVATIPSDLKDNQYKLIVNGVESELGVELERDVELTYEFGEDTEAADVDVIYKSDFDHTPTNTLPVGWLSRNEDGTRIYSLDGNGNPTGYGTGSRIFEGFSGDFNKAWYWCSRGTNEGYASFGELVMDALNPDGTVDESLLPEGMNLEDISLHMKPGKHNVSFKNVAWKGEPKFRFKLVDADDNVIAQFNDYVARPNLNGNKGRVSGALALEADFMIEEEGYYVMKFEAQDAPWQEFMLADVQVITMPSKAAYYNGLLKNAIEKAQDVYWASLDYDDPEGGNYAQRALDRAISDVESSVCHSPSEVEEKIAYLQELSNALQDRLDNIIKFTQYIDTAKEGIAELEGGKYVNVPEVAEIADIIKNFGSSNPANMSDDELAEVAPKLEAATAKLANVARCTNYLTYGIGKAISTYEALGTDEADVLAAAEAAVSDDRDVAAAINNANKLNLYKQIVAGTWKAEEHMTAVRTVETNILPIETEDGDVEDWKVADGDSIYGIDMTGYVYNPQMYRVQGVDGVPGWTVNTPTEEKSLAISYGGDALSDALYVSDMRIEFYGDATYKMEQTISNLPVGKYAVVISTRTPLVDKIADYGRIFYYNAQNDETQEWDKYIFATAGNDTQVAPFNGGSFGYGSDVNNTAIRNLVVGENTELNIGIVENYTSGYAMKHEDNTEQTFWTGTSFVDDARIYFVAPLEGYDYAAAAKALETALDTVQPNATIVDIYTANGVRVAKAQKGVNIVKMSNGKVVKVLVK